MNSRCCHRHFLSCPHPPLLPPIKYKGSSSPVLSGYTPPRPAEIKTLCRLLFAVAAVRAEAAEAASAETTSPHFRLLNILFFLGLLLILLLTPLPHLPPSATTRKISRLTSSSSSSPSSTRLERDPPPPVRAPRILPVQVLLLLLRIPPIGGKSARSVGT